MGVFVYCHMGNCGNERNQLRNYIIHGDNADLLTGFISVEASVGSCALTNIEISLLYMWIWSSLCLWMPWPHGEPFHSRWQCWSPNWIYFCRGISRFMWPNKHWNVSSIHVNLILTVLVDALGPWGAMTSTVTMLISQPDLSLSRHQYAHVLIFMSMTSVCS